MSDGSYESERSLTVQGGLQAPSRRVSLYPLPRLPRWAMGLGATPRQRQGQGALWRCPPRRSCSDTGARASAPTGLPPLGSAAGWSRRAPARCWAPRRHWLDVRFRFRSIGLACSPGSWERLRLGRPEPLGSWQPPRGRGPEDARAGARRPYSRSAAVSSRGAT